MRPVIAVWLFLCSSLLPASLFAEEELFTVRGRILIQESGTVYIQLVDREAFRETEAGFSRGAIIVVPAAPPIEGSPFVLEEIPAGTYGIRAFLDKNGNGEIDFSFRGIEPWGCFRPVRPRFRGPRFEEIAFDLDQDLETVTVEIK